MIEELCGDTKACSGASHGKEEIIVVVRTEVSDWLMVILGVEGDVARRQVHYCTIGCHHSHPQHVLCSDNRKRKSIAINYSYNDDTARNSAKTLQTKIT